MLKAYFDESGTQGDSPVMAVCGFVFPAAQARKFTREWRQALADYSLPFFHMKQFWPRQGPFKGLTPEDRDALLERLVGIILDRAVHGTITSIDPREYRQIVSARRRSEFGSAYAVCSFLTLVGVGSWARENNMGNEIAYFFEEGDPHAAEAALHMAGIAQDPDAKRLTCHSAHTFTSCMKAVPLQAADLLAWEWVKFSVETRMNRVRLARASFRRLVLERRDFIRAHDLKGHNLEPWLDNLEVISRAARAAERRVRRAGPKS